MTDTDRLAALLHDVSCTGWEDHERQHLDDAARLIAQGVRVGDDGLRAAAQAVVDEAETDDDFDGQFVDYLVPFAALDALRAALASPGDDGLRDEEASLAWTALSEAIRTAAVRRDENVTVTVPLARYLAHALAVPPAPTLDREREP